MPAVAKKSANPWLHVRVTAADGTDNVNLNVPFSLAEGLIDMVESSELSMDIQEELPNGLELSDIRGMWKDLQGSGDKEFLTAESGDEEVRMAIEDEQLVIDVTEARRAGIDKLVKVRVPTRIVDALLSGKGNELNLRAALEELRDGGIGDIVNVQDGDESVRIWVD